MILLKFYILYDGLDWTRNKHQFDHHNPLKNNKNLVIGMTDTMIVDYYIFHEFLKSDPRGYSPWQTLSLRHHVLEKSIPS